MKTQYYILFSLNTPQGFVAYGKYSLGNERDVAYELFRKLSGDENLREGALLHIDLMETVDELPVKIKTLCCTLEELGANCKLIAREIFRIKNLKEIVC